MSSFQLAAGMAMASHAAAGNEAAAPAHPRPTTHYAMARQLPVYIPLLYKEQLAKSREQISKRKQLFPKLSRLLLPPPYHALNLLKIIWSLLGYPPEQLANAADAEHPGRFHWPSAAKTFTPEFVARLLEFDPAHDDFVSEESKPEHARIATHKRTFETLLESQVLEQGATFAPLLRWAQACVAIKDTCIEQRERTKVLMKRGLL